MNQRLSLTEYSNKYRVSISTLRRRIRAHQADFVYQEGKYFLKDAPLDDQEQPTRTVIATQGKTSPISPKIAPPHSAIKEDKSVIRSQPRPVQQPVAQPATSSGFDIGEVLDEIKAAYRIALKEQEEQILLLKDEVADLRTLVRVLEADNDRLKGNLENKSSIDSWLEDFSSPNAEFEK